MVRIQTATPWLFVGIALKRANCRYEITRHVSDVLMDSLRSLLDAKQTTPICLEQRAGSPTWAETESEGSSNINRRPPWKQRDLHIIGCTSNDLMWREGGRKGGRREGGREGERDYHNSQPPPHHHKVSPATDCIYGKSSSDSSLEKIAC